MRKRYLLISAGCYLLTTLYAYGQWIGNDSGLCPNGRWVPSPIPGGGMGAMCVPDRGQVQPAPTPASRIPHEYTAHIGHFGAIAYSPSDGAMGWSYNNSTQLAADNAAMRSCSGSDCRVVVRFNAACGAVAVGMNGGWGADTGADSASAEHNAAVACTSYGNPNCRAIRWVCSSGWDGIHKVSCGNYVCAAGNKCSRAGGCIPQEAVDCGTYTCNAGMKCGSRNQCMAWDAVDCGGGKSCPVGHVCLKAGAECLTPQQIAERDAAERARKQAEAERIKREAEERKAAKQRRLEEQREAAKERQRLLAEKRTQGEEVRQAAIAEEKKQRAAKAEAQRAAAAEGKLQNSNQPSSAITAPNSMASPVESSSKPLAHSATVEKSVTIGTAFEVGRGAPIPYVVAHPLYGSPASAKQPAPTSSAGSSLTSSAIPTNSGHTASRRAASDPTGTTWASYGRAANGSVIDTRTGEVIVSGTGPRVSRSPTEFQAIGTTRFPPSAGPTPNQSASVQRPISPLR
jgi:hypothetical protein